MSDNVVYREDAYSEYEFILGDDGNPLVRRGAEEADYTPWAPSLASRKDTFAYATLDYDRLAGFHEGVYTSYAGTDIVAVFVLPHSEPIVIGELQTVSYSMHRQNTPVRFLGHTNPTGFLKGPRTIAGSLIFTVFNTYAFYRLRHFQEAIGYNLYPVADMLPPFDIVLTFANESGVFSKMKIYGVTIVDEGGTMSVDDLVTESTFSFMAQGIQPLTGFYLPGDQDG